MTPFIETFTGIRFRPLEPCMSDIRIEDIARALSNQCRFSGHTRFHYSVAQHSVHVSEVLEFWGASPAVQLYGVLHDASEGFIVDLCTPLKKDPSFGKIYRKAEKRLMRVIARRFCLPEKEPAIVKRADSVMLATEVRDLMPNKKIHWSKLKHRAMPWRVRPWSPDVAEYELLRRYLMLGGPNA